MTDIADLGFRVDTSGLVKGEKGLDKLGKAGAKAEKGAKSLSRAYLVAGTVVAAALAKSISVAIKFQKSMAEISTIVDTSAVSMDGLTDSVKEANAQFGGGLTNQASALYGIISAGAAAGAESTNILVAANKLAVGGLADLSDAAAGLSSVMNAYSESGLTAADASDSLFTAVKAGVTTIPELSTSLGKVSSIASAAGLTFDELTASIATLTAGGISTAESVTGLKAALSGMVGPGTEGAKMAESLGIKMSQADIKGRGLGKVLQEIRDKTGGNVGAMKKLLGSMEAVNAVLILTNEGGKKFGETMDAMNEKAGAADAAYSKIKETFSAQWDEFSGKVENVGAAIGEFILPQITNMLMGLNSAIDAWVEIIRVSTLDAAGKRIEKTADLIIDLTGQLKLYKMELATIDASDQGYKLTQERIKNLTASIKAYRADYKELAGMIVGTNKVQTEFNATGKATGTILGHTGDAAGGAAKKVKALNDELSAFGGKGEPIYQFIDKTTESLNSFSDGLLDAQESEDLVGQKIAIVNQLLDEHRISAGTAEDAIKALSGTTETSVSAMNEIWQNFTVDTQRAFGELFGDFFEKALLGGEASWSSFRDTIEKSWVRMLGNMVAAWATSGIMDLFKFGGASGATAGAGSAILGAGFIDGIKNATGAIKGYVAGLFGATAATEATTTAMLAMAPATEEAAFQALQVQGATTGATSAMTGLGIAALAVGGYMAITSSIGREAAEVQAEVATKFSESTDAINTGAVAFGTWGNEGILQFQAAAEGASNLNSAMLSLDVTIERGGKGAEILGGNLDNARLLATNFTKEAAAGLQDVILKQQALNDGILVRDDLLEANALIQKRVSSDWARSVQGLSDDYTAFGENIYGSISSGVNAAQGSIDSLHGKDVTNTVTTVYKDVGGSNDNRATGTPASGLIVPPGFPNDTFSVGLTSGERYTVDTPSQQNQRSSSGSTNTQKVEELLSIMVDQNAQLRDEVDDLKLVVLQSGSDTVEAVGDTTSQLRAMA